MRNVDLISPEDLLNSVKHFDDLNLPITMQTSEATQLIVLKLRSADDQAIANDTMNHVDKLGSANPSLLSKELNISVVMAMER